MNGAKEGSTLFGTVLCLSIKSHEFNILHKRHLTKKQRTNSDSFLAVSNFSLLLHRLKLIATRPSVEVILNWIVHAHISFRGDKDHEKYVRPEFS